MKKIKVMVGQEFENFVKNYLKVTILFVFRVLFAEQDPDLDAAVCYHCDEAAEKSIRSALYGTSGLHASQQQISGLHLVDDVTRLPHCPAVLTSLVRRLRECRQNTRYTDCHQAPSVLVSQSEAQQCLHTAEAIVQAMREMIARNRLAVCI